MGASEKGRYRRKRSEKIRPNPAIMQRFTMFRASFGSCWIRSLCTARRQLECVFRRAKDKPRPADACGRGLYYALPAQVCRRSPSPSARLCVVMKRGGVSFVNACKMSRSYSINIRLYFSTRVSRENMGCMQQDVLVGPMRVPQLQRRRNNLASLEATLEKVAGVQQSQAAVQVRFECVVKAHNACGCDSYRGH